MNSKDIDMNLDLSATWVPIDSIEPNEWNPNQQTDFMYGKTIISILEKGFVDSVKVREVGEGKYELVDGEHRWKAAGELSPLAKKKGKGFVIPWTVTNGEGEDEVIEYPVRKELAEGKMPVVSYGAMSDGTARELTLILNGTRGEPDTLKLAEVIKELDGLVGTAERVRVLPFTEEEQSSMMDLLEFDWAQFGSKGEGDDEDDEPKEEWVNLLFTVPPDALSAITDEIKRIGKILEINPRLPKEIREGLILEKICVNSSLTPIESFE